VIYSEKKAVQNGGGPREQLVDQVPSGGENLNYGAGDKDKGEGGCAVPGQPIQVESDAQDDI